MIRRPPRSTLFPYTTSSDLTAAGASGSITRPVSPSRTASGTPPERPPITGNPHRSEEHTSELQSLRHLVCRLLLEKKKKKKKQIIQTKNKKKHHISQIHTTV